MKTQINKYLLLLLLLPAAAACVKDPEEGENANLETVHYTASEEVIANPERGFYTPVEVFQVTGKGISETSATVNRNQFRTLYLLEFHLTDFVSSDISEEYLNQIRLDFESLRTHGAKCVLRFCYSNGFDEKDKPWDATPDQVLRHIAQVKPLLQEYYDVIMVVQAGFIGSWGEWYYTENFTDNSSRKRVVDALLDAVPADRQIELRTPAFKMSLYGFGLADTLTRATAHQGTVQARLGGHNDCYLASANDQGTYRSNNDRTFWSADSRYTIMGGETCGLSSFCHCEPQESNSKAHGVLVDMAINHFTYLNQSYHPGVLGRWRSEGCFEELQKRLGYRYVLQEGRFTKAPKAGESFHVALDIRNDGFAPAQNPRDAELVLTDKSGKVLETWPLKSDPRYWMPDEITTVEQEVTLPAGLSGEVTLSLNLPDPCKTLRENPRFSIRLANEGVWDEKTGYNKIYEFTL